MVGHDKETGTVETSLHRELKAHYAGADARIEVRLGRYRIDAMVDDRLIEIQHGSLAAIRDKISALLAQGHEVLVVKPIVTRKRIVRYSRRGGRVLGSRLSPKRGTLLDIFHELVYFTRTFPHPKLVLEVPLVEIEEWRYPGQGRRRRRRSQAFQIEDQRLLAVVETHRLATTHDLQELLPRTLPTPFDTGHLAAGLAVPRWVAQRVAYCLRKMNAAREVGRAGNARLYELTTSRRGRARRAA